MSDDAATGVNSSLKVLVADDNPLIRELIVAFLKARGHTGIAVTNGAQALRCLERFRFDLVMLDVTMPVLDGLAALQVIRQHEQGGDRHVPVIVITGHDLPGDRERFLAMGADGYISKPISASFLTSEIEALRRLMQP